MSWWGTLDATFVRGDGRLLSIEHLRREFEERDPIAPTGSEGGPSVHENGAELWVQGRLRDVTDAEDSPLVLAWFVRHARWSDGATLLWDLDGGPRYRYEWSDGELRKLRGVLDQ